LICHFLQGLSVSGCLPDGRGHHSTAGALVFARTNYLGCRRVGRRESLGDGETDGDTADPSTTLLFQDDFQMCWLCYIQEVLGVAAPELVFLAVFRHTFASGCLGTPFALELLFKGVGKLDDFDLFRGKDTKEEGPLLLLLVFNLSIGNYDVMYIFLVMLRGQPHSSSNFSLLESLPAFSCLEYDIVLVDLPKSVSLGFHPDDHKIDGNVRSLRYFLVLLHQRHYQLSSLSDSDTILRVVEPAVVGVELNISLLVLLVSVCLDRVGSTS
jgi:hypothetical protein